VIGGLTSIALKQKLFTLSMKTLQQNEKLILNLVPQMNPKQDMVLLLLIMMIPMIMMLLQLKLLFLRMPPKKLLLKKSQRVGMEHQKVKHHRTNMMLPVKDVTSVAQPVKDVISVVMLVVTEEETRIANAQVSVEDVKEDDSEDKIFPNCLKCIQLTDKSKLHSRHHGIIMNSSKFHS
jgi:hypothetical protein